MKLGVMISQLHTLMRNDEIRKPNSVPQVRVTVIALAVMWLFFPR